MRLRFNARAIAGQAELDTAIRAVTVAEMDGATHVFASTDKGGGVSVYRLTEAGTLRLHDSALFAASVTATLSRDTAVIGAGDEAMLLLGVGDGRLIAQDLGADGSLGTPSAPFDLDPALSEGDRLAFARDAEGGGVLALAGGGVYRVGGEKALTPIGSLQGQPAVLGMSGPGPGSLLVTATSDGVQAAAVRAGEGLIALGSAGNDTGLGIAAPTALETVLAHGARFSILGAAGTDSLSVLELTPDGTLVLRDHLVDSRSSRFADLQDIAVTEVAGQVFVVAAGSDDGMSLLTLLPDGRLIHLDSLASAPGAALGGITRLSATHAGDALHVFAATQADAGLAHLSVPIAGIGDVVRGSGHVVGGAGDDLVMAHGTGDTLSGEAGDDIVVAGPAHTTMTGGAGADLFVMRADGGVVRITDFDVSQDRLDLSDYPMLRNPDQLTIDPVPGGAHIAYRDDLILIDSHDGATLDRDDLFGLAFDGPDRLTFFTEAAAARAPDPDPDPDPDPTPANDRLLLIRSHEPNPVLAGAEIRFHPDDPANSVTNATADDLGRFDLSAAAGETGTLHILRSYSAGAPALTVGDALDVLRLAVGLQPSFGPATPADRIASDFDRDGTITVGDALDVLRVAVGLSTETAPEWLFLDPAADLAEVAAGDAPLPDGQPVTVPDTGDLELSMTVILRGDGDGVL